MKRVLILATLALVALTAPAYAASVVLQPLYDLWNQAQQTFLDGLAMAISGWVMFAFHKYVTPYLGAQLEAKARDSLNTALANGVRIAMQKTEDVEKLHTSVDVQNQITALAAQYAIDHAPDAIDRFGLTPEELALKALAYIPTPPTTQGTTGATITTPPVETKPLAQP